MKPLFYSLMVLSLLVSCSENTSTAQENSETQNADWSSFGMEINSEKAIEVSQLPALVAQAGVWEGKVNAVINSCCQKKGCWMNVSIDKQTEMKVKFKDYGFFVPMDASGKQVIMQGVASMDTVSVEMLQHYAQDAGKSPEEIAAITQQEVTLSFIADGVLIKD